MTTSTNTQPAGQPAPGAGTRVVDTDEQARKRQELNLSPHRDTAPQVVQRPPDASSNWPQWLLVGSLSLLLIAAGLLLLGQVLMTIPGMPVLSWNIPWPFGASGQTNAAPAYLLQQPGLTVLWHSDFARGAPALPDYEAPGQFSAQTLSKEGVYRMIVDPGAMGWTLFETTQPPTIRLETNATISAGAPVGQAGLVARFQDEGNFYQFTVDGRRQFEAMVWREGAPSRMALVENNPNIRGAGEANVLTLEDRGDHINVYVNNGLIYDFAVGDAKPGRPGIVTVGTGGALTTVDFDWLALYTLDTSTR